MLEHKLLLLSSSHWESERTALEGVTAPVAASLRIVGVVASVKALAQFRVAKDFVRLVDLCHLLLRGRACAGAGSLVRMVQLTELDVGPLDILGARVSVHIKDLVVVLCLATLQQDLRFVEQLVEPGRRGVVLFRVREEAGGVVKGVGVEKRLCFVENARECVGVVRQEFSAVWLGAFVAVDLSFLLDVSRVRRCAGGAHPTSM